MSEARSERRIDWRRLSRGVFWVGIGTFLLLNTTGTLGWGFWYDALPYWPILLVALGARILFDKSGMPWLVLASPALIVGTLSWVAITGPGGPVGDKHHVAIERGEDMDRWTLDAKLSMTTLDVETRPAMGNMLLEVDAVSRRPPSAWVSGSSGTPRVRLRDRGRDWVVVFPPTERGRMELGLADDLPLTVELALACTGGDIDLQTALLRRVEIDGAFNDLRLHLPAPDSDVRIDVEGAFNLIELVVPENVPVSARTDGFMNFVDGRERGARRASAGYRVRVDGAFSRTVVVSE